MANRVLKAPQGFSLTSMGQAQVITLSYRRGIEGNLSELRGRNSLWLNKSPAQYYRMKLGILSTKQANIVNI